jgi:hypothetical protein
MRSSYERRTTNQFSRAFGITQSSPASAGLPGEMMLDPRRTRQPLTLTTPCACPVQRFVSTPYVHTGTATEAKHRPCHLAPATPGPGAGAWRTTGMARSQSSWPALARPARGAGAWRGTGCPFEMLGPSTHRVGAPGSWRDGLIESRCSLFFRPGTRCSVSALRPIKFPSVGFACRANAELSRGAQLSDHDDASLKSNSPGAHRLAL